MSAANQLALGFSPCPNDTFIFYALVHGLLPLDGFRLSVQLQDVETLNRMAGEEVLDITKLSVYAWLQHRSAYRLIDSGAALGHGCGPLVVARPGRDPRRIARWRMALPGRDTTAHLLFRLWSPTASEMVFVPYDHILTLLSQGQVDGGVIIHENRFTYERLGFNLVADLGAWWETQTGLPIPLGVIAAHRRIPVGRRTILETAIRDSIDYARRMPREPLAYMRKHAQEMAPEVLCQHVATYVNDFSRTLGEKGREAIDCLASMARQKGLLA